MNTVTRIVVLMADVQARFIKTTCHECNDLQNKAAWQEVLRYYGQSMTDDDLRRQLAQLHNRQGHSG